MRKPDKNTNIASKPQTTKAPSGEKSGANSGNGQERIAKRMARAGLCSRREAENWITAGRVSVNGVILNSPALTVGDSDIIEVDGKPLPVRERTRLWLYHKPVGRLSTNHDPQGRPTIFEQMPKDLPRLLSVGRLDMATEGLLLMTNDGGLARILELPSTGWLRRYRVRAHGKINQAKLDELKDGIAVDGVLYGSVEAVVEREQGSNTWLNVAIREGKNREVKNILGALGLEVNRLIRVSYGPFQLGELSAGEIREIRGRTLRDQLGERLVAQAGADFDAPVHQQTNANTSDSGQKNSNKAIKNKVGKKANANEPRKKKLAPGAMSEATMERLGTRKNKTGNNSHQNRVKKSVKFRRKPR